ncbi:hypothetical protein B0T16DRAFT_406445 [Cercophora newfieldiana]|uniref:Uncharacterized protein n=1 Tax=Cercophora newfieldiana TaxID=92897 RepID=A0AA39YH62_9PEZI|nr:hypothetical protein B0T16DRAFT_406445 [Cercophora newfieldiana]
MFPLCVIFNPLELLNEGLHCLPPVLLPKDLCGKDQHNDVTDARHKDVVSSIRCMHSCCNADRFFACNLGCKPPSGQPIGVDPGCNLRCAQGCCPEGVACSG